jgi:hypothetical protein
MKKIGLLCASALAVLTVSTFATSTNSLSLSTDSTALAATTKFSRQNYAVMAYLKYTKQDVNSVADNSLEVESEHGHFEIDNENDSDFVVEVNKSNVVLKATDQNGKRKVHTFAKAKLEKQFSNQQNKLNSIVESDDDND